MKSNGLKCIFIVIQLIMYGAFLTLDMLSIHTNISNRIKFLIVVFCLFYVTISIGRKVSRQHMYLVYALALTVVSDMFILLSDYYLHGVLTFIIAQQIYGIRINELYSREKAGLISNNPYVNLILRIMYQGTLTVVLCLLLWINNVHLDILLVVSIFYFMSLCTNVVRSARLTILYPTSRDIRYFAIGLTLFLLCDINVGLFNLSNFLPLNPSYQIVYRASSILMWTFYAPSQVLIALSGNYNQQIKQ